jgi:undecaprenyl-diphosphatase UppP
MTQTIAKSQIPASLQGAIHTQLFIDGKFVDAESGETMATLNPHDNSEIAQIALAGKADVDKAIQAAQKAYPTWSRLAAMDRGRILLKLADLIEANAEQLAMLESLDTGHPIRDSRILDVPRTAVTYRYFGGMADKFQGDVVPVEAGFLNYVSREPLGVVGQVVPWNFPLMFTSWKMAPALAAGNCVVLKPAEITPLSSLRIAELMAEAGMPDGVVNILPGLGQVAGQYIAEHPDIAKIAFTGSTATGRRIVQASAGNLKKVQLELGGKGANIVFEDAFLPAAIIGLLAGDAMKSALFGPVPVTIAWLVGGVLLLRWKPTVGSVALHEMPIRAAFIIGCAQSLALWPGVSRSLVTLIAALAVGLSMSAAIEFSFLLGLITLSSATVLDVTKHGSELVDQFGILAPVIGFVCAFITAVIAVKWMVGYLESHSLRVFGWYRLVIGAVSVVLLATNVL